MDELEDQLSGAAREVEERRAQVARLRAEHKELEVGLMGMEEEELASRATPAPGDLSVQGS